GIRRILGNGQNHRGDLEVQNRKIDTAIRAERQIEFAGIDQSRIDRDGAGVSAAGAHIRPTETVDTIAVGSHSDKQFMPKGSAYGGEMKAEGERGSDDLLVGIGGDIKRKGGRLVWAGGIEQIGDHGAGDGALVVALLDLSHPVGIHRNLVIHSGREVKLVDVTQAIFAKLAARIKEPLLELRIIKAVQL